jgi:hypothetical protein
MQISGDLGNSGHLSELLSLTEPHFNANHHGLQVGNNLIKAHIDLGQLEAARRILDQLYALKCPAWQQTLSFWDTEIAKTRVARAPMEPTEPLKMTLLTIDGPVWLPASSPLSDAFSVSKSQDVVVVSFLTCTVGKESMAQTPQLQMADNVGRVSRGLPLLLAEQVHFGTDARVHTLVPWIVDESRASFVVCGVPWSDQDAANYARQGSIKADYVITSHLSTHMEPWSVELRLVRTIDGTCVRTLNSTFSLTNIDQAIPKLTRLVLALLTEHTKLDTRPFAPVYQVPDGTNLPLYLLRLEQLLAVRCAAMDGVRHDFLSGEREIIDGNLQLCVACPDNITTRTLLAQTLSTMRKVRPDIIAEFAEKITLLQKEKPLRQPAHDLLQRVFDQTLRQEDHQ